MRRQRRRQAAAQSGSVELTAFTDRIIEWTWLAAVFVLPLTFSGKGWFFHSAEPQQYLLHLLAAIIAVAWLTELGLESKRFQLRRPWRWAGTDPSKWVILAFLSTIVAALVATAFSPLPLVSFFGRDPNEPGFETYSTLSYVPIFLAVALRVHRRDQVQRMFVAIAASATLASLLGISQHFGWDPVGYGAGLSRVTSTFANPLFFGAFLVMAIPISISLASEFIRDRHKYAIVLAGGVLGLQFAGLWFSGSRGPWIAFGVGVVVFAVVGYRLLDRRELVRIMAMSAVAIFVALALALPPTEAGERGVSFVSPALDRLRSLGGLGSEASGGSQVSLIAPDVGGRFDIWTGALQLVAHRGHGPGSSGGEQAVRHLFGYGPEMYAYLYPYTSQPKNRFDIITNAHDYPLQILLEWGWIGLIATGAFLAATGWLAIATITRIRHEAQSFYALAVVAIVAALVGRTVEQSSGVAQISDFVAAFGAVGLLVAIYRAEFASPRRMDNWTTTHPNIKWLGFAAGATVALIALFVWWDLRMFQASIIAENATIKLANSEFQESFDDFRRADRLAQGGEAYSGAVGMFLLRTAESAGTEDAETALNAARAAHDALERYRGWDPQAFEVRLRNISAALLMYQYGDTSVYSELVQEARDVAQLFHQYPGILGFTANVMAVAGQYDEAIEMADRAIALDEELTGGTLSVDPRTSDGVPQAWWSRGLAFRFSDRPEQAESSFLVAVENGGGGYYSIVAHRSLASLYEDLGNQELAAEHNRLAGELERK